MEFQWDLDNKNFPFFPLDDFKFHDDSFLYITDSTFFHRGSIHLEALFTAVITVISLPSLEFILPWKEN